LRQRFERGGLELILHRFQRRLDQRSPPILPQRNLTVGIALRHALQRMREHHPQRRFVGEDHVVKRRIDAREPRHGIIRCARAEQRRRIRRRDIE
jgi:uncharacterized short protein YbdD (DUF466 family)